MKKLEVCVTRGFHRVPTEGQTFCLDCGGYIRD